MEACCSSSRGVILTGVLAGALPALRAGRTDLNASLKEGGREVGLSASERGGCWSSARWRCRSCC